MNQEQKRAVIYVRVSTQDQEGAIGTQIDKLVSEIKKAGRKIVKVVKDEDVSGDTDPEQRKNFPLVLRMAEEKKFDERWVASRDRLARDVDIGGYIRVFLRKKGIRVVSLDDSDEKILDRVRDVLDEMELDKYRKRRAEGIDRAIREKRILHRPPFG